MTTLSIANMAWGSADRTEILAIVSGFHPHTDEPLITRLMAGDAATRLLFDEAISGAYGEISPYVAPTIDPAVAIAAERAAMVCSRLQGRLVLGETVCATLDAMAEDPLTPWAMRETIKGAGSWYRTSQSMDELGYLLQYTPEQMDALFRIAMELMV